MGSRSCEILVLLRPNPVVRELTALRVCHSSCSSGFRSPSDSGCPAHPAHNYNVAPMRATIAFLAISIIAMSTFAATPIDLAKLTKDQEIDGFTVASVY